MKMKKRFLSILLSLVMVLGLMPGMSLTAYAATASKIYIDQAYFEHFGSDTKLIVTGYVRDFDDEFIDKGTVSVYINEENYGSSPVEYGMFSGAFDATNFSPGKYYVRVRYHDDSGTYDDSQNEYYDNPIFIGTTYPLWVGGTQVTSANAGNIDGDNKASYNADTKTLTLNGYIFSGSGYLSDQGYSGAIYAGEGLDLNLVLSGTNSVENIYYSTGIPCGIYAGGALTISGNGTLNADAKERGISCRGKLTIIGGSVTVEGVSGHGMFVDGDVEISGGTVSVEARSDGICSQGGSANNQRRGSDRKIE